MHTFIEITDFHAPELDIYARLTETQLRSHHGIENSLFIAESPHVIERALDAGCEPESLLMLPKMLDGRERGQEILARCGDVPVYVAEEDCLKQLTGFPLTRGVLCAMKRPPLPTAETLLRDTKRVVVLEDVMNPTNLGAIFRSAAAMGMDAVLLTPASTDPLYRRCIRVSMGTVFQIPWAWIGEELTDWPEKGMELLRANGFKTAAMALREDSVGIDYPALMAEEKLAVILGTEGDGLADRTIADCDYTVRIPMAHGKKAHTIQAQHCSRFSGKKRCACSDDTRKKSGHIRRPLADGVKKVFRFPNHRLKVNHVGVLGGDLPQGFCPGETLPGELEIALLPGPEPGEAKLRRSGLFDRCTLPVAEDREKMLQAAASNHLDVRAHRMSVQGAEHGIAAVAQAEMQVRAAAEHGLSVT